MKYPYCVKANGRYYAPGEEIIEAIGDIEQNGDLESNQEQATESRPTEKPKGRRGRKPE